MLLRATALAVLLLALSPLSASAQDLIHYWNFNAGATGSAGNQWPSPVPATQGSGVLTHDLAATDNFGGSPLNARGGDGPGGSFSAVGEASNGRSFQLNVSTQGYENLVLTYATRGTASGFDSQRAEFSVDGGSTWTHIGTETGSRATTFYAVTYDLSPFEALNNRANAILRFTLSGATSTNGNNRFDNITLEGTFVGGETASGSGTALLEEALLRGGQTHTLDFEVFARSDDAEDRLTHIDLTLPESFGTVATDAVSLEPEGGTVSVDGRTIRIADAEISQSAPLRIAITGVTIPDASGAFTFGVQTGAGADQTEVIAAQPELRVWSTPEPIAQVAANNAQGVSTRLGEWVTVQGVITVADQFRTGGGITGPSYVEDETGGMAVFSPNGVSERVAIGDEVILLGRVDQFNGLNQLDDATTVVETLGRNRTVEPVVVTLAQLATDGQGGAEAYEGRLVRVNGVTVNTAVWNVSGSGTNYQLSDGTATLDVRINPAVDFAGQPAPGGSFDIVGALSQFRPATPYIGGYQLMPRFTADILDDRDAPAFVSAPPFERAASPSSVTFSWTTDREATAEVYYVRAPGDTLRVASEAASSEHTVTLTGLAAATVYDVTLCATTVETTCIQDYPVVTAAPEGTSHTIRAVFTGSVDHTLARDTEAESGSPLPILLERIEAAERTLDMMFYSLSGNTAGRLISNALIAAHERGVRVRVIMENSTSETAPPRDLRNAGVPFITDAFGANDGQALHHNKVLIADALTTPEHDPAGVWVMTGSWNPTEPGTFTHNQNILFIQDGALAAAHTREFEQMWGSSTATPDASASRFGERKRQTAPTVLWLGDVYTRLFFSPQGFGVYGSTEDAILDALRSAEHEIDLGLNLITRLPIVDVLRERHDAGVRVRGAVGEITTTGSVFVQLAAFADIHDHPASTYGLLHHKYAIVDAEHPEAGPVVITGSHNWSRAANERNDENTLILYSADLANQYLQELAIRYREAGGEGEFSVSIEPADAVAGAFSLSGNYPNPFRDRTAFSYTLPAASEVTVVIYDVLGREVERVVEAVQPGGTYTVTLDGARFSSGTYLYRVEARSAAGSFSETGRMVRVR
jgi:hypothetical protein